MTGFPWLLLVVGLLAVAFCLLREAGYLQAGQYPADLGFWATMMNSEQTKGWRIQYERHALNPRWRARFYPPYLDWPATLRVVLFRRLTVLIYLGSRRRPT